jgi:F-type H+-transporting ATPase subunit b
MLSSLLILAQAAAPVAAEAAVAHGEAASGISKIVGDFGLSWPFFIAQVINFSVVAFILWRFAFKPVLATLDERQEKIAAGLKYTEDMKAKLEVTQQESAAILKQASVEASRFVEEARKSAKDYLDKQTQETAVKANDMLMKAREAVELEHKKMLADARVEIARLVVVTTERVLAKKLSDADRAAYNDSASRELTNV